MGEILSYNKTGQNQFKIDYPYYGLFGTAEVTTLNSDKDPMFKCRLLNGTVIYLKKMMSSKKWVDLNLNLETPLSKILGNSIEEFFQKLYK